MPLFQKEVKVTQHHRVFSWSESILKSDLALSTTLTPDQINKVVQEVRNRLSDLPQPIHVYEIGKVTHFALLEMNYKNEADIYINFLQTRRKQRTTQSTKVVFVTCKYCGLSNPTENKTCAGCGSPLDLSKTGSKIV